MPSPGIIYLEMRSGQVSFVVVGCARRGGGRKQRAFYLFFISLVMPGIAAAALPRIVPASLLHGDE